MEVPKSLEKTLRADFRNKKEAEGFLKVLKRIEWLKSFKEEEITVELLEKVYKKVQRKHKNKAKVAYAQAANSESFSIMIRNEETGQWIYTIYAISLLEAISKVILVLYAYLEKGVLFNDKN